MIFFVVNPSAVYEDEKLHIRGSLRLKLYHIKPYWIDGLVVTLSNLFIALVVTRAETNMKFRIQVAKRANIRIV